MGFCSASPAPLLTACVSWVKGSVVVIRLLSLPALLLTLYLEVHGNKTATASLILLRLSRRLRLSSFVCILKREHAMTSAPSLSSPSLPSGGVVGPMADARATRPSSDNKVAAAVQRSSSFAASTSAPTTPFTLSRPSPRPFMPHARSMTTSHVDIVRQGKRLSLQFPLQPAAGSTSLTFSPRSRPQSWVQGALNLPTPDATPSPPQSNILAVLAAQERYVLELKEELTKAEADLKTLKKHYALHEAAKRRSDTRKVAQLQPLAISLPSTPAEIDEEDGSDLMQREIERRKALLNSTKTSQRKVFSGSRHLRTLSLLSPDRTYTPSFPQPLDLLDDEAPANKRPDQLPRSITSPEVLKPTGTISDQSPDDGSVVPNIQRDKIIRAGTQMANDFKNGLFTFIEDIRQATVGDEAINGNAEGPLSPTSRRPSTHSLRKTSEGRPSLNRSLSSKKTAKPTSSFGDDFWKENGLSEPKTLVNKQTHANKPIQTPQKQTRQATDDFEEWDNWETPNENLASKPPSDTNSSDESEEPSSPVSGPGSSRTSMRYHSKRHDSKASSLTTASSVSASDELAQARDAKGNSLPWPDLVKLSPNNLKRTASHLMKEWEKQLTPPPESRSAEHSHGDYIGRSGSPASLL